MKYIFKALMALLFVGLIGSCSDNKEAETTTVEPKQQAVVSKIKIKEATPEFKALLKQVPADTPYLFTNRNILEGELLKFHLKRSQQYLSFLAKTIESDDDADNKLPLFIKSLLQSLITESDNNQITGFKTDGHSILYGFNLFPVLRIELSDSQAVLSTIKAAQKESNYDLVFEKCGAYDCFTNENDKAGIAIILLEKQLVAAAFNKENKEQVMSHLMGNSLPKASYQLADWDKFLAKNHFQGYGDGFLNLANFYTKVEKILFTTLEQEGANNETLAQQKACSALLKKHLVNVPSVAVGITEIKDKMFSHEVVLGTSAVVTTALKAIPNPMPSYTVSEAPIIDFGLNLNFSKFKDALSQYTEFLISANESVSCDVVDPTVIRKMMGSLSMASMFGADQFKSIYFSANKLELDKEGKPQNIELFAAIGADNPGSLIQMLAMLDPKFATIKLPKDGSAIQLPAELLQNSKAPGDIPDTFISAKDHRLNIMVGKKNPVMKAFKVDQPTLSWSSVDGPHYAKIVTTILEQSAKDDESISQQLTAMKDMYALFGKVNQRLIVDSRGLVWQTQTNFESK